MMFQFDKRTAEIWLEQIQARLRQFVYALPGDKMLTVDEFAERIVFCILAELRDQAFLNEPPDTQFVIEAAMGMMHACFQTTALPSDRKPLEILKEMVN